MKIALVGVALPPIMGGLEVHIHQLGSHLKARGHDVALFGVRRYRGRTNPSRSDEGGMPVRRVGGTVSVGRFEFYEASHIAIGAELALRYQPDIIHVHCAYPSGIAAYVARILRAVPYVVTSHGDELMEFGSSRVYGWMKRSTIRRVFSRASHSLAVSEELRDLAISLGSPAERTERIANAVDVNRFAAVPDRSVCRQTLGLAENAKVILSLRRLSLKNGVHYLVRAFPSIRAAHPDAVLLVAGDGDMRREIEGLARNLGVREAVIFLGNVPNAQIGEVIAAADVGVFPSLAEATSIACLEVMAHGVPVVTSDVGGLPEIVRHGQTGLIVPFGLPASTFRDPGLPDNVVDGISSAVCDVLSSQKIRERLGSNAREAVLRYHSWATYARHVESIYNAAIGEASE